MASGAIYAWQGDMVGAALSMAGIVLAVGGVADNSRLVRRARSSLRLADESSGISNTVPTTLALVNAGTGPFPTLGPPGRADVFVTAADDIAGLQPAEISQRLGIPASDSFTVIRFPTPPSGLATPVNLLDPGFIDGGLTSGGAREFVLPNGPIPPDAMIEVIGP